MKPLSFDVLVRWQEAKTLRNMRNTGVPQYLVDAFIHALGQRYDGDPRLGFVGLGLLGTWGECTITYEFSIRVRLFRVFGGFTSCKSWVSLP